MAEDEEARSPFQAGWITAVQNIAPRFWAVLGVAAWMIMLMPQSLAGTVPLIAMRVRFGTYISILEVFAPLMFGASSWPAISDWLETRRRRRETLARLNSLSIDEWRILLYCLKREEQTVNIDSISGNQYAAAISLQNKKLLSPCGGTHHRHKWPFIIPDLVWERLHTIRFDKAKSYFGKKRLEVEDAVARDGGHYLTAYRL